MFNEGSLSKYTRPYRCWPQNFEIQEAVGSGDCFYDSIAKGLSQLKPDILFTVESLRMICKGLAENNLNIKSKVITDARIGSEQNYERNDGIASFVIPPSPEYSDDDLWSFYLNNIEYSRKNEVMLCTKDNKSYTCGNTLHLPIWGRPEIEGQLICQRYDVKLHVIEQHSAFEWLHQVIDSSGSRTVDNASVNYEEENVVYIINESNSHFKALIRQQTNRSMEQPNISGSVIESEQLAKRARFHVHENSDYVIDRDSSDNCPNRDLKVIITDKETGVDLKSTKWSEGMQQFIELKHCIKLSAPALKAVFNSNVSYLKGYKGANGLSGTLGSTVELESL